MSTVVSEKNEVAARPPFIESKMDALKKARLFLNAEATLQQATSVWLDVKPELRLEAAIELLQSNEVSFERAAEIAGLNRWVFHDSVTRRGIEIIIDTDSVDDLDLAVDQIKRHQA